MLDDKWFQLGDVRAQSDVTVPVSFVNGLATDCTVLSSPRTNIDKFINFVFTVAHHVAILTRD